LYLDDIEEGNAPQAVNDRLAAIGQAVEPIPSEQIAAGIKESVEGGAVDLIRLDGII